MGENSAIEWTHHTFNPWIGCTKVAAGCAKCYAERDMDLRYHKAKWGPAGTRVKTSDANWRKPIRWNADAAAAGERRRVFCASLADVFEDWDGPITAPGKASYYLSKEGRASNGENRMTLDDVRLEMFALIDATPNLDWLLLTKRPENIRRMLVPHCLEKVPGHVSQNEGDGHRIRRRDNVWLLTSIATQADYDRNAPHLWRCRDLVPVLGFSAEPLLGPIKMWHDYDGEMVRNWSGCFQWVIAGGESGPGARPMHPAWARSIRDQCAAAGVPFFFKQWGEWVPWLGRTLCSLKLDKSQLHAEMMPDGTVHTNEVGHGGELIARLGKKAAGRLLDGELHDAYPESAAAVV